MNKPTNIQVDNRKPINKLVDNRKPITNLVDNRKPDQTQINFQNFSFVDTRTITVGTPYPWGINWCITYPNTFSFSAPRI